MNLFVFLAAVLFFQTPSDEPAASANATSTESQTSESEKTQTPSTVSAVGDENTSPLEIPPEDAASSFVDTIGEVLDSGALGLLIEGGVFMWPILLLGIVGAGSQGTSPQ